MALALFKPIDRPTHPMLLSELPLDTMGFTSFKFNNRPRPSKDKVLIISCFSEFGCEIVGCLYCLPRLLKRYPGRYVIGMGWYGREYLYRHLVDEFWEVGEEFMWLRDHTYAFHHVSDNLKKLEKAANKYGSVVPSSMLGRYVIGNYCRTCGKFWNEWRVETKLCPSCRSTVIISSIFGNPADYKKTAVPIPKPSSKTIEWAKGVVRPNTVGIFARDRKTYGRNLPKEFYIKLIQLLESLNFNIIWLGEKQNTLPCPLSNILDFSRQNESRDLEKTLAIISLLEFTIQFWTASSRLSGLMGTKYILFESPEQILVGGLVPGQEGKRLELTTFGPKKIVLAHYLTVLENQEKALELVKEAISEIQIENYDDIIGLVEDKGATEMLMKENL